MYRFYMTKLSDGDKVRECAVARNPEEAAKVINQYFAGCPEIGGDELEEVTVTEVDTDQGTITWAEYQKRFNRPQYWGYYDPRADEWNRLVNN